MKITRKQLRRIIREVHPRAVADNQYVEVLEAVEELVSSRNVSIEAHFQGTIRLPTGMESESSRDLDNPKSKSIMNQIDDRLIILDQDVNSVIAVNVPLKSGVEFKPFFKSIFSGEIKSSSKINKI